jgi:hypothetical protein
MGIDSKNECNCIFVSGVFSKLAIVVGFRKFKGLLPKQYSVYTLDEASNSSAEHARMFHPKIGFRDDVEAVGITRMISKKLSHLHDEFAKSLVS